MSMRTFTLVLENISILEIEYVVLFKVYAILLLLLLLFMVSTGFGQKRIAFD